MTGYRYMLEASIEYEAIEVDLEKKENKSDEYLKVTFLSNLVCMHTDFLKGPRPITTPLTEILQRMAISKTFRERLPY